MRWKFSIWDRLTSIPLPLLSLFLKETINIISQQVRPLRSKYCIIHSIHPSSAILHPFHCPSYNAILHPLIIHPAFHPLLNFSNGLSIVARIRGRIGEFSSSVNRTLRHLLSLFSSHFNGVTLSISLSLSERNAY